MQNSSRAFTTLALTTAVLTIVLIVVGAVVRVTDSGLGCGDSWPLCDGKILPPLDNLTAWIEWSHRLLAILIGVLGLATLVMAWRTQRGRPLVFGAVVVAAFLFFVQSALGAIVVILELPPTMVALHLGTAMLLLAALLVSVIAAKHRPGEPHAVDSVTWLIYITAALSFVIILTGALVRGSGSTLACVDWPLCNGAILPTNQGQAALIHMLHRFAVLGLGVSIVLLVWQVAQSGRSRTVRQVAMLALIAYLAQAGVGAIFVLTTAGTVWGAGHVGLAAITWASLVILSVMEYLGNHELVDRAELQWKPQSKTVAS
jgi:heme A synthase